MLNVVYMGTRNTSYIERSQCLSHNATVYVF